MSLLDSHNVSGLCLKKDKVQMLELQKAPHLFSLCRHRHLNTYLAFVYVVIDSCKDLGHLICFQNLKAGELRGNGS